MKNAAVSFQLGASLRLMSAAGLAVMALGAVVAAADSEHLPPIEVGLPDCNDLKSDNTALVGRLAQNIILQCERDNSVRRNNNQIHCPVQSCLDYVDFADRAAHPNLKIQAIYDTRTSGFALKVLYETPTDNPNPEKYRVHCKDIGEIQFMVQRNLQMKEQENIHWGCKVK